MKYRTRVIGFVLGRRISSYLDHVRPARYYSRYTAFPRFRQNEFVASGTYQFVEDFLHNVSAWNRTIQMVDCTGLTPSQMPDDLKRMADGSAETYKFWSALDHRFDWVTENGKQVIWCEPYADVDNPSGKKSVAALQGIGWYARKIDDAFSIWNPDCGTVPVLAAQTPETIDEIERQLIVCGGYDQTKPQLVDQSAEHCPTGNNKNNGRCQQENIVNLSRE